jgi:DNA methylase/Restriction endonuclease
MPHEYKQLSTLAKLDALYEAGLVEITEGAAWPTPVRYLKPDDGQPLQDIWAYQPYTEGTVYGTNGGIDHDVAWLGPTDPERLGYPTQKPVGLLERIIRSSCPTNGVVLDPFCGCGTTIEAAQKLNRAWIGIDITYLATHLIKTRLRDALGYEVERVIGEPTTSEEAAELGRTDPYQFQYWALGLVGAGSTEQKKGADRGIDGRLYFHETPTGPTKQVIFSVKAGKVQVQHLRDLRGVVDREKAQIGVLISLQSPTRPMRHESASAGLYESSWGDFPKLQLLTVEELLDGRGVQMPPIAHTNATFRRARYAHPKYEQGAL